jgi:pimeloyl-ACP methyl ester carboxylesterase
MGNVGGMLRLFSILSVVAMMPLLGRGCGRSCVFEDGPYEVTVESGQRKTDIGDCIAYDLFIPEVTADLSEPPWPAVVISHGFARDKSRHRCTAEFLARRGIVVLTPNLVSLLRGEKAQLRNIADLVDHVTWLIERSATEGNALEGLIDPERIGLAGHSAGGAISLEATVDRQATDWPVGALCLLDAVPWDRTVRRTSELSALPFASLRSEPGACNNWGSIKEVLAALSFPSEDVLVTGGTHCDPEDPTNALCTIPCGGTGEAQRQVYRELLYLFFADALAAPLANDAERTYEEALAALEAAGAIVRSPAGSDAQAKSPG